MKLKSLVGGHVESTGSGATLRAAARHMAARDVGSLVVIEDGQMKGIITERDVSLAVAHDADPDVDAVGDWMSDYPCLARADWEIEQAMT